MLTTKLVLINYIIHIINYEYYMISTLNRNQNNNIHNNLLSLIMSHVYSKTWICPPHHCSLRPTWWPQQPPPPPGLGPGDLGSRRLWRLWCWYELPLPETWHHTTRVTEMKIYHITLEHTEFFQFLAPNSWLWNFGLIINCIHRTLLVSLKHLYFCAGYHLDSWALFGSSWEQRQT